VCAGIWDTDACRAELRAQIINYYDGQNFSVLPTKGLITKVARLKKSNYPGDCPLNVDSTHHVFTTAAYDAWGNRTSEADPRRNTTYYTYDNT